MIALDVAPPIATPARFASCGPWLIPPFISGAFQIRFALQGWERDAAAALRRAVFCDEQHLFADDDHDEIDRIAETIVAVATVAGIPYEVIGTVRVHAAGRETWIGSRLAVKRDHRRIGALGAGLIRVAVASAHARGCTRFLAHVQSQNVPLFRKLHWKTLEEVDLHNRPHHLMAADLDRYPPLADAQAGIMVLAHRAD